MRAATLTGLGMLAIAFCALGLPPAAPGATYVVDQAAAGAADTNPGTEEKPFKTIQQAADAARAGDTVYVMEGNYLQRVAQGFMVTTGTPGTMARMTFLNNIFWKGLGWDRCATGLFLNPVNKAVVTNNTFAHIQYFGLRNQKGDGSMMSGNLFYEIGIPYTKGPNFTGTKNLVFACKQSPTDAGKDEVADGDPNLAAPNSGNVRLTKGSAAIGAGADGGAIGALEWPNVYYVDPRHPGASDEGFGYAGWPYKSAGKALAVAETGETVVRQNGIDLAGRKDVKVEGIEVANTLGEAMVGGK